MPELSAIDVGVLVATVATALFTGWAIWQRWRYTPRPLWIAPKLDQITRYSHRTTREATVSWVTENRGDAAAHDVRIFVSSGSGFEEMEKSSTAVVAPGESVRSWVVVPVTDRGQYNGETDGYDQPEIFTWTPTTIRITWRQHPNLKRVKAETWIAPRPNDTP